MHDIYDQLGGNMVHAKAQTVRPKAIKAGIFIRFLASGYDLLIIFGLLFIAFIPIVIAKQYLGDTPKWLETLLIVTICYAYFAGFWNKAGMTTGMRPWKLQVAMIETGDHPNMAAASIRFIALGLTWIALGATFFQLNLYLGTGHIDRPLFALASIMPALSMVIMILTPQRQALHDLLAGTSVFRVATDQVPKAR